jgi:hypothetical protein
VAKIPDLDLARIRRFCEGRVPDRFRDQVRVEAQVRGTSVTICERRSLGRDDAPTQWSRMRVAQLRFDPDSSLWTLHWPDRNSRWHPYADLDPGAVHELLAEIDDDPTCIFWG